MRLGCVTKVAAPARTVFACVDEPEQIVRWVGGAVEHVYLTERTPASAVGQQFRQKLRQGRKELTFFGEITAWEPPQDFAFTIPTDAYSSKARFRITPDGPLRSVVAYTIDITPHTRASKLIVPLLRIPLGLFVRHQIGRLRHCAERATATHPAPA
jgi:uncharacterized protein YndB with AHSA1/START domain